MKTGKLNTQDWQGVFSVPPLARRPDATASIDWNENRKIVGHIRRGGITRFLYGGNAFLYHLTLAEYADLLGWLADLPGDHWAIPSIGPSFGRLADQVALLKRYSFPAVMHLPCSDPRDAAGLERGLRWFADHTGIPLILYLKEENSFGADRLAGLDAVGRLVADGLCVAIKYAVVRDNPAQDSYLDALLERVPREAVVSGIGERPAIIHMRNFGLPGYTTGSGCIGASWTQQMFTHCSQGQWEEAATLRERFIPLEDIRDAQGPARVLHAATEAAGIAQTGPVPPFVTALGPEWNVALAEAVKPLA